MTQPAIIIIFFLEDVSTVNNKIYKAALKCSKIFFLTLSKTISNKVLIEQMYFYT